MKQVKVEVCFGTTCHIMGGAELLEIEQLLDEEINPYVDLCGVGCLDFCKEQEFGKAPFVRIDGEVMGSMTPEKLILEINKRVQLIKK